MATGTQNQWENLDKDLDNRDGDLVEKDSDSDFDRVMNSMDRILAKTQTTGTQT